MRMRRDDDMMLVSSSSSPGAATQPPKKRVEVNRCSAQAKLGGEEGNTLQESTEEGLRGKPRGGEPKGLLLV